jgi:23S rRNA pseudouridine955/2504/2580 synthase
MPEKNTLLLAGADDEGRRLDRILRKALPNMPLSGIHRLLRQGEVSVDGVPGKAADRIKAGANIRLPNPGRTQRAPGRTPAEAVKTIILWESPDLLILNKPPGLIVHGPDSLDDLVQAYLADRLPPSLSFKPGPLHRLDKPTSGILAFSKTLAGAQYFSGSIHQLRKVYIALADGPIESPAVWNEPLLRDKTARKTFIPENPGEGRPAETLIRPLAVEYRYSLI